MNPCEVKSEITPLQDDDVGGLEGESEFRRISQAV